MGGIAAADIVSVVYDIRPLTPGGRPHLVVQMALRERPSDLFDYQTGVDVLPCGSLDTAYAPPTALTVAPGTSRSNVYWSWCTSRGTAEVRLPIEPRVSGRTITWAVPFDDLPHAIREGTLVNAHAFTQNAEPVLGHVGPATWGHGIDWARMSTWWSFEP